MKLFVWNNCESISQYENGTAFALADNLNEAISAILYKYKLDNEDTWTYYNEEIYNKLKEELKNSPPFIYEYTIGFYIRGSA